MKFYSVTQPVCDGCTLCLQTWACIVMRVGVSCAIPRQTRCLIQCVHIMATQVYLEKEGDQRFAQEPYIWPVGRTNVSAQRAQKSMTCLCEGVDHLQP